MSAQAETIAVSKATARLAFEALLHMERGVRPWAEMEDEEHARAVAVRLKEACSELKEALSGAS